MQTILSSSLMERKQIKLVDLGGASEDKRTLKMNAEFFWLFLEPLKYHESTSFSASCAFSIS